MIKYYKLEGKSIVQCRDMMEWAKWFETADRHVALEYIFGIRVSTVFLGLDHNFSMNGKPLLFETMVFTRCHVEDEMCRYYTYEEAETGHRLIVDNIKSHPWSLIVLPRLRFWWSSAQAKLEAIINIIYVFINKIAAKL